MLDWDDLRFFLAVARHGSLSAAAKELRVAQSTAGRRLASLEASLGVRLLNRTPDGYVATLAGQEVRVQAERLEEQALALERNVGGRDTRLSGLVRVTCAEIVASHILAPCFADGPNQPVSPQQLQSVFGEQQVQGMASQSGMAPNDFLSQLSQHLPNAVNGMTPNGQLPNEGSVSV